MVGWLRMMMADVDLFHFYWVGCAFKKEKIVSITNGGRNCARIVCRGYAAATSSTLLDSYSSMYERKRCTLVSGYSGLFTTRTACVDTQTFTRKGFFNVHVSFFYGRPFITLNSHTCLWMRLQTRANTRAWVIATVR